MRRLAHNTLFVFVRLVCVLGITLYTSRVVFGALGAVDFGLFVLMWGLVSSFAFFSAAMGSTLQRYLAFELGLGRQREAGQVFGIGLSMHLGLGLLAVVVGEVIGLYLLYHRLEVPSQRLGATLLAMQVMMLGLVLQLVGQAYESVLIAREHLKVYAWVGILEAVLKLCVAYLVVALPGDRLVSYACLFVLSIALARLVPALVCRRLYPESRVGLRWQRTLGLRMLGFGGWSSLSSAVWHICQQGTDLMLNVFFGPIMNAARGITAQVSSAVGNVSLGFFTTIRTQIVGRYASGDRAGFVRLIYSYSRYGCYVLWLLILPLGLRMDYILDLWLGTVPEHTSTLALWALLYTLVNALDTPLSLGIQATGHLRWHVLGGSLVSLVGLPVAYIGLGHGAEAAFALEMLVYTRLAYTAVSFVALDRLVELSWADYSRQTLVPIALVCGLSGATMLALDTTIPSTLVGLGIVVGLCSLVSGLLIWWLGLEAGERATLRRLLGHWLRLARRG